MAGLGKGIADASHIIPQARNLPNVRRDLINKGSAYATEVYGP
jgi:hypothetical protein